MKKINSKKPKETTRDRHLKWIKYYSSKNFGIWVECTACKKWRRTYQYSESHEVPEHWCCSLLTLESGKKGTCNDPEEDNDEQYLEYCPGSVVWAKLEGYPWWPGMVDEEPDTEEFYWRNKGTLYYNVTFLDEKPTRAWIPERFICHFLRTPKVEKGSLQKPKQNRYAKAISKAKERAEAAMLMTIKDRLYAYNFAHLYKGRWPAAPNFEENDVEENESKNVDAIADTLLKELDELGSIDSTDTDDEKIEKDFSGNENNETEQRKIISKNSDSPSFKKKAYTTKYLKNKNSIQENGAVSPFMNKKNSKSLLSVKKTLSDTKDQTSPENVENITNPLQEKGAKGVKRTMNRKSTPKKQKNLENTAHSLTDDIIDLQSTDSEHESDKTLNTCIALKVDDSKTIHDCEEKCMAEGNSTPSLTEDIIDLANSDSGHESDETLNKVITSEEDDSKTIQDFKEKSTAEGKTNFLPEMPNYVKQKTEKKSTNVKPLKEKEFNKKTIPTEKSIDSSHLASNEEMFKHMDESISKVSEFVENESSAEFKEYTKSEQPKIVQTSNEPQNKIVKLKKSQNSCEKNKQFKNKIETLKKSTAHSSQEHPETKMLQNESNSSSKSNKQKITGTTKQIKKSQENIKSVDSKLKEMPKQPIKSFSLPIKNNAEQKDEVVVDKDTRAANINKEKKILKLTNQNPKKENSFVKVKPNFKLPIKTDKQALEAKTKDLKILTETVKLKAVDIKRKNSDGLKENCPKNLVGSGLEEKSSMNEKSPENMQSEKCVPDPKENVPEVISSDTSKPTENEDENFFYVSVSDEEMDCENSNG